MALAMALDTSDETRFLNRELSWLDFNARVLALAEDHDRPLLERAKFLAIFASNLDEFFMVRAAGVFGQVRAGITTLSQDGRTPEQQLVEINRFVGELVGAKQAIWRGLKREMAAEGIEIVDADELTDPERVWLEALFMTHIFPILTPIAVDPAHPFPFILNKGLTMAVEMQRQSDGKSMNGLIPIPGQLERFIRLRVGDQGPRRIRFVQLETVIGLFLSELFSGVAIRSQGAFRVLRDSDIELQEEAEDLVRSFETQLKRRRRGNVIRLEIEGRMPERLRKLVVDELEVDVASTAGSLGVFGRSGAGKTSLIETIAGWRTPVEGRIRVGDTVLFDDRAGVSLPIESRGVGYVPQDALLLPHWTVGRNVRAGRSRQDSAVADEDLFARTAAILEIAHLLERPCVRLSGGERQRVALARALV